MSRIDEVVEHLFRQPLCNFPEELLALERAERNRLLDRIESARTEADLKHVIAEERSR